MSFETVFHAVIMVALVPMAGGVLWFNAKLAEHDRAIHNFEKEFDEIKRMLHQLTEHLLDT